MILVAKFNETILKGVRISGVCEREQDSKKGSENENFHRIESGNKIYVGRQAKQDALDCLLLELIRDRER
jgi:hypothetical protein